MLRVALVGCGKIADDHAAAIARSRTGRIVAVCDREELMARQCAERFGVALTFTDLRQMLAEARPQVVHVTTPPQSHYPIARECLESGCHVYVEKPFTLDASEAEQLIRLAEAQRVKLTAGHDDQFSHVARRLRAAVETGYLGGPPVHMESYYGYDLGYGSYARALLGDRHHWVRKLPGKLLHNIISHGIARVAEYLQGEEMQIVARAFVSPRLRECGEAELFDELRVMILEAGRTTAYFTFSSQMRPSLHEFRVYGPRNGLILDHDKQTLLRLRGPRYTSFAEQFIPPWNLARQHLSNWRHNVGLFLQHEFHPKAGMQHLIQQFHLAVAQDKPLPIPYREILLTARIMDCIFQQISSAPQNGPLAP